MIVEQPNVRLARQVDRVPSMRVPLDREQELRFDRLLDEITMIDMHQHPLVLAEEAEDIPAYLRGNEYVWGYEAARHGGWATVATANILTCIGKHPEPSFSRFSDLVDEIGMMLADLSKRGPDVVEVHTADEIVKARQAGQLGFLPTVEHLSVGQELHRVDVLYGMGVRLAGLTYTRKSALGDGQFERTDAGLSDLGVAVVDRMNDLGMAIDLSHVGTASALEAIERSAVPTIFSHNAAYAVRPARRARKDEELLACARGGGLICITAVPNSLSDDPEQDINCVLDHYDYMVKLVGVDHVGIGTDTLIGDHVGFHKLLLHGMTTNGYPAPYLNGLESPADGTNIIRGLIARGYSDADITKIAGQNALDFLRRVVS